MRTVSASEVYSTAGQPSLFHKPTQFSASVSPQHSSKLVNPRVNINFLPGRRLLRDSLRSVCETASMPVGTRGKRSNMTFQFLSTRIRTVEDVRAQTTSQTFALANVPRLDVGGFKAGRQTVETQVQTQTLEYYAIQQRMAQPSQGYGPSIAYPQDIIQLLYILLLRISQLLQYIQPLHQGNLLSVSFRCNNRRRC